MPSIKFENYYTKKIFEIQIKKQFTYGLRIYLRYESNLEVAKNYGIKKGLISGTLVGFLWATIFCIYSLGFWYGWKLSTEDNGFGIGPILAVSNYN